MCENRCAHSGCHEVPLQSSIYQIASIDLETQFSHTSMLSDVNMFTCSHCPSCPLSWLEAWSLLCQVLLSNFLSLSNSQLKSKILSALVPVSAKSIKLAKQLHLSTYKGKFFINLIVTRLYCATLFHFDWLCGTWCVTLLSECEEVLFCQNYKSSANRRQLRLIPILIHQFFEFFFPFS